MGGSELAALDGVPWSSRNHRYARIWLEQRGWTECGTGDWAVTFRSPDGELAARVCAFDPSYGWFVELCRRLESNPYLPRIDVVHRLEGGGLLAVMEFLEPTTEPEAQQLLRRWENADDSDPDLRELRTRTHEFDVECRATVPFWMGIDLETHHVLRAANGQLKLIDLVGVGGGPMVELIESDIEAFLRIIPRQECVYMLEIPHFSNDYAAVDEQRVRSAFAAYDRTHRER